MPVIDKQTASGYERQTAAIMGDHRFPRIRNINRETGHPPGGFVKTHNCRTPPVHKFQIYWITGLRSAWMKSIATERKGRTGPAQDVSVRPNKFVHETSSRCGRGGRVDAARRSDRPCEVPLWLIPG